jgi:hypothetical protein
MLWRAWWISASRRRIHCAIESGVVLTLARQKDLVEATREELARLDARRAVLLAVGLEADDVVVPVELGDAVARLVDLGVEASFHCAIESGVVLTLARQKDLVEATREELARLDARGGAARIRSRSPGRRRRAARRDGPAPRGSPRPGPSPSSTGTTTSSASRPTASSTARCT